MFMDSISGSLIERLNENLPGSLKFGRNSTLSQPRMEESNEIALGKKALGFKFKWSKKRKG